MAQFDLYKNPSKSTRSAFPYILDVQNTVISEIATRIVVPLGRLEIFQNERLTKLTPEVEFGGDKFVILVPQIASIPTTVLKKPVSSLSHMREEVIAALDFAITGI